MNNCKPTFAPRCIQSVYLHGGLPHRLVRQVRVRLGLPHCLAQRHSTDVYTGKRFAVISDKLKIIVA